jgi:hypothetical protein
MKLALALLLAAIPRIAAAECAGPHWIGTPSGTPLPLRGTLFVHDTATSPVVQPMWHGRPPALWRQTRIAEDVVRVDYLVTTPTRLGLDVDSPDPRTFTFDPAWRAPAAAPSVIRSWHRERSPSCPTADSVMLQIDQATAAFRVHWTYGGKTTELVVPARTADGNKSVLELGKLDAGQNLDPAELHEGGEITVTAIRLDGSEIAVTGIPAFLATANLRTIDEGMEHAFRIGRLRPDPVAAAVVAPAPEERGFAIGNALIVVIVGIGAWLAIRTRIRTPGVA